MCFRNRRDPEDDNLCLNLYANSRCMTFTSTKILDRDGELEDPTDESYQTCILSKRSPTVSLWSTQHFTKEVSDWINRHDTSRNCRGFTHGALRDRQGLTMWWDAIYWLFARLAINWLLQVLKKLWSCWSVMNLRWDFQPAAEESWREFTQSSSNTPHCTFYDRSACDSDEQTWRMWRRCKRNKCYRVVSALLVNVDTEA